MFGGDFTIGMYFQTGGLAYDNVIQHAPCMLILRYTHGCLG